MRKLIANLTENARLFAETRKLLGSGGKVLEVVEDEQEQAPEVAAEFYPASANGSSSNESAEPSPPPASSSKPAAEPSPPNNSTAPNGGNGSAKSPASGAASPPAGNNGNGSHGRSGFNRLRNEFLTTARRVAIRNSQAIREVVEWASAGAFKYGDIGRMTEADIPKLLAATGLMVSSLPGAAR
jgi:pyruvate/2-oxoglutarate dehydrogenase complex dihydrolipoamide acyltransferase (E2) component